MKQFYLILLLSVFPLFSAGGCTTISDVRKSQGLGTSRIYNAHFDTVWGAIPKTIKDLDLSLASENKEEGYIFVQKGVTKKFYGDNIAVFVTKVDENKTKVEVVSVCVSTFLTRKWEKPILDKLSEMLDKNSRR